jgi:hypothetical protein
VSPPYKKHSSDRAKPRTQPRTLRFRPPPSTESIKSQRVWGYVCGYAPSQSPVTHRNRCRRWKTSTSHGSRRSTRPPAGAARPAGSAPAAPASATAGRAPPPSRCTAPRRPPARATAAADTSGTGRDCPRGQPVDRRAAFSENPPSTHPPASSFPPGGMFGSAGVPHAQRWVYRLTGRLWNTTSCLTAAPLTHALTHRRLAEGCCERRTPQARAGRRGAPLPRHACRARQLGRRHEHQHLLQHLHLRHHCTPSTPSTPYSDEKVANRNGQGFRGEIAHSAVSRRPPISLDTIVARTEGYTYDAKY